MVQFIVLLRDGADAIGHKVVFIIQIKAHGTGILDEIIKGIGNA